MGLFFLLGLLAADPTPRTPVVVELFTSEGCSSCPPADKLLLELQQRQPIEGAEIIALGEHVDYWNDLGWHDPFSSRGFSVRQQQYASAIGGRGLYTPQMIVDGRQEFVGSDASRAKKAVEQAAKSPKARVAVQCAGSSLKLSVDGLPAGALEAEILLALTEDGLASNVAAGENRGRQIRHASVARSVERLGRTTSGRFSAERILKLESGWNKSKLSAVALVQETKTLRILGAATAKLAACNL